jgi:hypothetical protein
MTEAGGGQFGGVAEVAGKEEATWIDTKSV